MVFTMKIIWILRLFPLTPMVLFGQFQDIQELVLILVKEFLLFLGASSSHSGIDIPAPEGTQLIAVADGEITFTQFLGAGGYTITLSFDNYKVTYCHCSPNYIVKVGDKVEKGDVIAKVGSTGRSTGPHVHYEVLVNGIPVNPQKFIIDENETGI